jgi:uncharacterized damage-inducible protein DinB
MPLTDLLIPELKSELKATRTTLERIPAGHNDFRCHPKSSSLDKLAGHVAQLSSFGSTILTTPTFDFGIAKTGPLIFENAEQIVAAFDTLAAQVQSDLAATTDESLNENWSLTFNSHPIYSGTRFGAYRSMFLNHLIHHRAQLGVYLRLLDAPVPATYGPSADDRMGF